MYVAYVNITNYDAPWTSVRRLCLHYNINAEFSSDMVQL